MIKEFSFYAPCDKKNKAAFNDALPIGNGHIGAMVYGDPLCEKLILNNNAFALGNPKTTRYNKSFIKYYANIKALVKEEKIKEAEDLLSKVLYSAPEGMSKYSVCATLFLKHNFKDIENYKRILDMENGLVKVCYDTKNNHIYKTYFSSYPDNLVVCNINSKNTIDFDILLTREKLYDTLDVKNNVITLTYKYNSIHKLIVRVKVVSDGSIISFDKMLSVKNSSNTRIYISLETTYYKKNAFFLTNKYINTSFNYDTLLKRHTNDFNSLFKRQILKTSSDDINYYYAFSRYLMISSSRDSLPSNLQGLWCEEIFPSWDSKYTLNINLEMNYFNVFNSNLISSSIPLYKLLEKMYKNGRKLCKKMYGVKGFVAFHNTDIYGDVSPQDRYMPATYWPFGAAFMSLFIMQYYRYTKDLKFLKKYYYILVSACDFFVNVLEKNENGKYVLGLSLSPENSYLLNGEVCHIASYTAMDTEILYDLFKDVIDASAILNKKSDKYKEILYNLPDIKICDGKVVEWDKAYDEVDLGHRHYSHLFGLYPGNLLKDKHLEKEAYNSLMERLNNGGALTGWSKAWATIFLCELKKGEEAYKLFEEWILKSTSSVGLDLHPPFQIDGNFGIARAIFKMFILEYDDEVIILPSKILEIENGEFIGIRLKSNICLDIKWKNNKLYYVSLISKEDSTITLKSYDNKLNGTYKLKKLERMNIIDE